ncbi:hypothetical protein [Aeoliella sp. SH292]|uniref:hypothetical protein n=1 Tax=Aeoliella sp. SH292 TaxID=3454464 RepID=UPI003F9C46B3
MESLRTLYRASVMIGTLVVGALAYRAYGPELEKLKPLFTRAVEIASELISPDSETDTPLAEGEAGSAPAPFTALATPLQPPALLDQNVQPAGGALEPVVPPLAPESTESPVAAVVRALNERGVNDYSMTRWGADGTHYRFQCSVPWGEGGVYSQHFEAVAETPADAARQVLDQVNQWSVARASAPNYR